VTETAYVPQLKLRKSYKNNLTCIQCADKERCKTLDKMICIAIVTVYEQLECQTFHST